ncbi:histidine kinase [Asanoa sp. NPDC049518]|uniref:sensor histidine kinase n=1 Tax=unclassified Asanoa TaxID=2685164 RepID=UPI0034383550
MTARPPTRLLGPVARVEPTTRALNERLRLTVVSTGYALSAAPALAVGIAVVLSVPLALIGVGFPVALVAVPSAAALAGVHRRVSGALLDDEIPAAYADTSNRGLLARPVRWLRDGARWRDVALVWFSATGGLALSALSPLLLVAPVPYLVWFVVDPGWPGTLLLGAGGLGLLVWWITTPALTRARAVAERAILGGSRLAELARRVERVTASRDETRDLSAAEIRRIERDLHDGAQARMAAVGMSVGLAGKLLRRDPDAAADLLEEARRTTLDALEDLRSVVRGIHPPVLADRGLGGAIEALALAVPLPVAVSLTGIGRLPAPVESAAYFAVAECVANAVKHSAATRACVRGVHDGTRVRLTVGDDGRGGADATGSGLVGVARRLAAFDGSLAVDSPPGGPTIVTLDIPCPT